MLMVSTPSGRQVLVVEITGLIDQGALAILAPGAHTPPDGMPFSGSYEVSYAAAGDDGPAMLRHKISLHRRLTDSYTMQLDGDLINLIGSGSQEMLPATLGVATDYLSLNFSGRGRSLDVIDSYLNASPISFNGYTLRGLHLTELHDSNQRGMDVFAGIARPATKLFGGGEGRIAGFMMPVVKGESWDVRAGMTYVAPHHDDAFLNTIQPSEGGAIWQADARFVPNDKTTATAGAAFANGALSWTGRIDRRGSLINLYGEALSFNQRSPLVSIGAQPGGRQMRAFAIQGQPTARLTTIISYNGAASVPVAASSYMTLNSHLMTGSVNYSFSAISRLGVQYIDQRLDTDASTLPVGLRLQTRSLVLTHGTRLVGRWNNDFDGRLTWSREAKANAAMEGGCVLRDELRHNWQQWATSFFANYTRNTPSLLSLVIRNPYLLPTALRSAYEADPVRFLVTNRDLLPVLLSTTGLPNTDNAEVGMRFRGTVSRYSLDGEVRYGKGPIQGREQSEVSTSVSFGLRLDEGNNFSVNLAHAFSLDGTRRTSLLNVTYTHRFGGGFGFKNLFGLNRGHIEGRVFSDRNGNSSDDASDPGVAGAKVQLDGKQVTMTDAQGKYRFASASPGTHVVKLVDDDLGVSQRASTSTEQQVLLSSRQTANVSFGLSDSGFIAGRVFNDLMLAGKASAGNLPGIAGVRIHLRYAGTDANNAEMALTTDDSGAYAFRNLAPGSYTLEIEAGTLPPAFRPLAQTAWTIKVASLQANYFDVPLAAQRAILGRVFIDKDGDGQFDPQKDEAIEGARVTVGTTAAVTGPGGAYILRDLPAGKLTITACAPKGQCSTPLTVELDAAPTTQRDVNFTLPGRTGRSDARPAQDF